VNKIIALDIWQLASAYLFILILLLIVRWRKIPREKEILISALRMTLQLVLVGYVLTYMFDHPSVWLTLAAVAAMEAFAIFNVYKRVKVKLTAPLKRIVAFSMTVGTLGTLLYFDFIVVHFSPWFSPRYFIPIAGMIIGNSMTGITLGIGTLAGGMKNRRHLVEAALMLGATPREAMRPIVNESFDAAILPTINSMVGMGIVFLPGMMTGQILSGTSPVTAIEYQIAVMLGITGAVSLTVILCLHFAAKAYFNHRSQLRD